MSDRCGKHACVAHSECINAALLCRCDECIEALYRCDCCQCSIAGRERHVDSPFLCSSCSKRLIVSFRDLKKDEASPGFPRFDRWPRGHFAILGKFRVYFNRHGAEPLMWCISPEDGSWEIAVRDVQLATPTAHTVYRKKETADEDDGRPSGWIAAEGQLTILPSGFATIGDP